MDFSLAFRCWAPRWLALVVVAAACCGVRAQDSPGETDLEQSAQWPMETLELTDGRTLSGLMQKQSDTEVEFVEVVRRRGRPMYLVVHYPDPKAVKSWKRLKPDQRKELEARIGPLLAFKSRRRIEAGRMEDVDLRLLGVEPTTRYGYAGARFTFGASTDEETARRAVVRLEQMFRAYQQVLPPRVESPPKFRVLLLGSKEEYQRRLRLRGLRIDNPAFYAPQENLIVAGDELRRFADQLLQATEENQQVLDEYTALDRSFSKRLNELSEQLREQGMTAGEVLTEVRLRRSAWNEEYNAALARVAAANRRNEDRRQELSQHVFARLYHETFHAYYENYVFPSDQFDTPRWLHEGMAQVFETGQVEADTLRIDAPDPAVLTALQQDLQGPDPISLAELLTSPDNRFLAWRHDGNASKRFYVASWGLAWYLAFDRNLIGADKLEEYVSPQAAALDPIPRFERFVGQRLPEFERAWRIAMLQLKAR